MFSLLAIAILSKFKQLFYLTLTSSCRRYGRIGRTWHRRAPKMLLPNSGNMTLKMLVAPTGNHNHCPGDFIKINNKTLLILKIENDSLVCLYENNEKYIVQIKDT